MRDLIACRETGTTETVDVFYQKMKYVMLLIFLAVTWFGHVCRHICFDLDFSFFSVLRVVFVCILCMIS